MAEIRTVDLKRVIQLCGEVTEIATPEERIEHFLLGTMELTGTDILGMVAMTREEDHFRLGTGFVLGINDSQARILNDWYLEGGAYRRDPFNRAMAKRGLSTLRRQDMLSDSDWYSDPHIEGLRSLSLDGVMASIRNINEQQVTLVARREWGATDYTVRDRETLDYIADCFKWFFLDLGSQQYFGSPVQIPSRHERIMDGLMMGLSEKEIGEEVSLSSRTVHKYVQELFRHYGVNSRPKLMALWTRYPGRTALPPSIFQTSWTD